MRRLFNLGYGSAYSWRLRGGSGIWRSMEQSPILIQRRIRLLQRLSVGSVIRYLLGRGGVAVLGIPGRFGSAARGIR